MEKPKLDFNTFIATFLGIGFLPGMPGTWGSLAAFGLYLLIPDGIFLGLGLFIAIPVFILFCLASVYVSSKAELKLGHDSGHIVIDEVCGYFLAVMFLPQTWIIGIYAFELFRVFDIAKPFPINRSQNLPKGWGVVVDDLIAGIYANVLLQLIIIIYPRFFGL
ncbi:MAG: phosphatidylglycerophosphatase A [Candidatus Cloacimonas sp.]|jgi:phosphatidylglycerophosphatase A|nr:phosphatidylglycerophosphatase A [Candidatus Cloacimonas sp.]